MVLLLSIMLPFLLLLNIILTWFLCCQNTYHHGNSNSCISGITATITVIRITITDGGRPRSGVHQASGSRTKVASGAAASAK